MTLIKLDAEKILELQFARSLGLNLYEELVTIMPVTDVSRNLVFQRKFNAFYRIRRNAEWRRCYYSLFEQAKEKHYGFADVIRALFAETGNVECSFSSKMIATIDPNKPIWDQYVIQNLGLDLKGKTPYERVENAIGVYESIENWFAEYMQTEEALDNIAVFDRILPSYAWLSDVKKIDFLLWSNR